MSAVPPPPPPPSGAVSATAVTEPRDPFAPGLQKAAAASGIAAALLLLIAFIVNSAETPDFNAPVAEYAEYVRDEGDAMKLSGFLLALSAFSLVFYAGVIRSALGAHEAAARGFTRLGYIVLAGFTLAATCFAIGGALLAAAGASGAGEPEFQKLYTNLSGAAFGGAVVGLAAALDAAGFIILRTRAFPAWLGWVALAGALFWFLTLFYFLDVADDESIFGIGFPLGFLALFVWLIGTSVLLVGRVGRDPLVRREVP
jgi:hypothetical protein